MFQTRNALTGIFPGRVATLCRQTLIVIVGALLGALAVLALLFFARPIQAAPIATAIEPPPAGLFFRTDREDAVLEAPILDSQVEIRVSGQVARVKVRQSFINPSTVWLEGLYVFPLPERSAVDRLVMTVGGRRVEGRIMERAEAERVYRQAAAEGKRASLLTSARPNVFVTAVANIGPKAEIVVEIEYQDRVDFVDGRFDLRFPMVVAPRYTPGPAVPTVRAPAEAPSRPVQPIAHRPEIPPPASLPMGRDLFGPVRRPGDGPGNRLALTVLLDPGLPITQLDSLYHEVTVTPGADGRRVVTLADGEVPANRDFVLTWTPALGAAPEAAIFAEEVEGDSYLMMSLLPPPIDPANAPRGPRDLILVVDTSGSMHGASIAQAKTALALALDRLRPGDHFNVIRFASGTAALFPAARPADAANIALAQAYVAGLAAEGGTNMLPALNLALSQAPRAGRLRQVVFLTDGAVGNEHELFTTIAERLQGNRLFTIGIGSAPNSYFMRKAAAFGRGSFTYIGDVAQVSERLSALFRKLESPVLTDVTVAWPDAVGAAVEVHPRPIPDLYAEEPVSITARLPGQALAALSGEVLITARRGAETWRRRLPLESLGEAAGVAAIWARAKVADIQDGLARGRDPAEVREDALAVALEHRLVTRYTGLVAVDQEVVRPQGEALVGREVPRELPEGWSYDHVFSPAEALMPYRSLPAPLLRKASYDGRPIGLPQTATPAELQAVIGILLLLLGGLLLAGARGRRPVRARGV